MPWKKEKEQESRERLGVLAQVEISNMVVKAGLIEKGTIKQRLEEGEIQAMEISGRSVPGRVSSVHKGPEAGKLKEKVEAVVGDKDIKIRSVSIL